MLRFDRLRLVHLSGFAANLTKPHAERLARSGRPLRDDSELVANTIRFSMSFLHWQPVRRSLSDNGK